MNACIARILSCAAGLAAGCLLLDVNVSFGAGLLCLLLLSIFYILLKPLAQVLVLPVNLFLFGLAGLFADALLVWWASAWTPGLSLTYFESLLIAALNFVCFLPYDMKKRRRLRP